ncbi:MAG: hypothetical protein ABFC56_00005 [Clostridiaceae bacterium]
MEQLQSEKPNSNKFFCATVNALGTFLFVFLMMHMFVLHFSGVYDGMWLVPYFSIPAYFFCLTFGAEYWIGENLVRRRTYFASTFISPAILLCGGAYFMPGYVLFPGFRSLLAALFSVGIILYSILDIRKNGKNRRQRAAGKETLQVTRSEKWGRTARIVCLLSICCVLFENCQKSIMVSYGFMSNLNYGMNLSTFSHYVLSILSAILLARFVKAEFIPRNATRDEGVS